MIPEGLMLLTGPVMLAHAVGDYILQSDWMATQKIRRMWPALVHGVAYTIPFLLLTLDWRALAVIAGTHVVIDRWRLARYLVWAKNWMAPLRVSLGGDGEHRFRIASANPPWDECRVNGYDRTRPIWLTTWLTFVADNVVHVVIALGALWWVGA